MSVKLENENIIVKISEMGAELTSVKRRESGMEYMWTADPNFWGRHAPNLFPIVGRLKGDRYKYRDKTYFMTQHGFARDNEFDLVEKTSTMARLRLVDTEETQSIYPFHFQFDIIFRLTDQDMLGITYVVTNTDTHDIYFSVGGHPGFRVPLEAGDKFTDYYVNVDPKRKYARSKLVGPYLDNNLDTTFNSDIPLRLRYDDYKDDAIILRLDGNPVSIILAKLRESHGITMHVQDAKYLGIWTPYGKDAPFVCLEPWWGIADTVDADGLINHKYAINSLAPAQTFTGSYSLSFF
ncbi:aldose 1-epimerase family protein [Weissella paramesenteroides]|uniref:aldose 1-epimerase family protein n=1 Tax=Weissella paramesenteroides TaxID=1249 RepID=UPI00123BA63B|nr:aldose 1-epimerase family protein [Weissella paramesenteroides]KAA8454752.1 aldose 1-epimerase family protein [Weissella paramesenteroides]KAA8456766.1 aldose 1-epimerase family protein [Weissella paramesenteroides]KAA8460096.1 aldose 1-epimerase family protein [Weissella paramesenteroides]KAA8461696.1 aldose 1-epimerase family protein [Weissella paramesenteroides]KAA8461963.1 aldose 1-epimerase family protein [Weissella paramesenteroides]